MASEHMIRTAGFLVLEMPCFVGPKPLDRQRTLWEPNMKTRDTEVCEYLLPRRIVPLALLSNKAVQYVKPSKNYDDPTSDQC